MLRVKCPRCGVKHEVQGDMAGKPVRCGCGNRLVVKATPVAAGPPPKPSTLQHTVRLVCVGCMEVYDFPSGVGQATKCRVCRGVLVPAKPKEEPPTPASERRAKLKVAWAVVGFFLAVGLVIRLAVALAPTPEPPEKAEPVAKAKSPEHLIESAQHAIAEKDLVRAKQLLGLYLNTYKAQEKGRASSLLKEIETATSDASAAALLQTLTDSELAYVSHGDASRDQPGRVPDMIAKVAHPTLRYIYRDTLRRNHGQEKARREAEVAQRAAAEKEERARARREKEKLLATPIRVTTIKEMLEIHEAPEKYEGRTVVVSPNMGWVSSTCSRHKETKGYLFQWRCGEDLSSSETFGQGYLRRSEMNYWCNTDCGLLLKKIEPRVYNRCGLTFVVTRVPVVSEIGTTEHYYIAAWVEVSAPRRD